MRHGKNRKYSATGGRKARRERALERLKKSKFTPKTIKGKERNEKNWTKKKEAQIERLEERVRVLS
jgi:hypothetical protein|tara:strand:+ start:241 stop:438 length:198 start_codon:yes stop_codon:yes gene_type:complete